MKKSATLLLLFMFFISFLSAQETQKESLTEKEIKKVEKEAELQNQFEANYQMLLNRSFVLEADYVESSQSSRIRVKNQINFLMVDSTDAALQLGSDNTFGYNGLGGSTAKGKITSYELTRNDKRKSCYLSINVYTMTGYYDVLFDIPTTGTSKASVSGSRFGSLVYIGYVLPLRESKVSVGVSLE